MSLPSTPNQTLSYLHQRFQEVGIQPNSRFGQNFLIDLNLLRVLVESAMVGPRDVVLEVGCGTGALTAMIAERAAAVVSVEIDPQLHQLAQENLERFGNVTLRLQDALANKHQIDPAIMALVRERLAEGEGRQFKLVANLPYSVATPILSNLLSSDPVPRSMTATIQKELAERISADPSTKDYSALSVWIQSQCRVKIVRSLPPSVFWPRPKVMSAILQIWYRPEMRARIADPEFFHQFVRSLFLHRRKFLRGVLVANYKHTLGKEQVDAVLAEQQLAPDCRAEQLEVDAILRLSDAFQARLAALDSSA